MAVPSAALPESLRDITFRTTPYVSFWIKMLAVVRYGVPRPMRLITNDIFYAPDEAGMLDRVRLVTPIEGDLSQDSLSCYIGTEDHKAIKGYSKTAGIPTEQLFGGILLEYLERPNIRAEALGGVALLRNRLITNPTAEPSS